MRYSPGNCISITMRQTFYPILITLYIFLSLLFVCIFPRILLLLLLPFPLTLSFNFLACTIWTRKEKTKSGQTTHSETCTQQNKRRTDVCSLYGMGMFKYSALLSIESEWNANICVHAACLWLEQSDGSSVYTRANVCRARIQNVWTQTLARKSAPAHIRSRWN